MNRKIFALFLLFSILLASVPIVSAQSQETVKLYLFWGNGCPHCAKEKAFLEEMQQKYPQLEVIDYEVWYNAENKAVYREFADA